MEKIKSTFKNHKKKIIVAAALLVGLGVTVPRFLNKENGGLMMPFNDTSVINKGEFVSTVTESGTVNSEDSIFVYPENALPVEEVLIKVGDEVEEGQVIARLNSSSIDKQIDTTQAQMSSSSRSAAAQIENARNSLNRALENKKNGTNSTVVSAENAMKNAYDQWQNAERTYENYKRSIEEGYNEALVSAESQALSLKNAADQAQQTYKFALEKQSKNEETLKTGKSLADEKKARVDSLKAEVRANDERTAELKRISERYSESAAKGQSAGVDQAGQAVQKANSELNVLQSQLITLQGKPDSQAQITEVQNQINAKQLEISQLNASLSQAVNQMNEANYSKSQMEAVGRETEQIQYRNQDLQSQIATAESDYQKYKAEYEQAEKTLDANRQEIEQALKNLEIAQNNQQQNIAQGESSGKSRQDTLQTYRKTADDLKSQYESSKENLNIAKIAQDSEISSLQSSLKLAQAGGDNLVNQTTLKYLREDLQKTEIKSPIKGTITEDNMVIGQTPTGYLVKIETTHQTIVTTQVKEYDFYKVSVGMETEITSDVLGSDKIFKGAVQSIDPTPKKAQATTGTQSNDVVYTVKLTLDQEAIDTLVPGMSVRVKYVLDRREDVVKIPTNSIYKKGESSFVLAVEDIESKQAIKEIPVKVITENDFESVVEFDTDMSKYRVISSPDKYSSGAEITLQKEATVPEGTEVEPTGEVKKTSDIKSLNLGSKTVKRAYYGG